jgi:4-amino-4-deoxy-L-arabinose transferase-like glycosyltransferase
MFIVLIPIFLLLLWLTLFDRDAENNLRRSFLKTMILAFAFCAVTTEIFSLFRFINSYSFVFLWLAADLILLAVLHRKIKSVGREFFQQFWQKLKVIPKFYTLLIAFIYLVIFIIALNSPPNTYDSLTYHLARVAHWIQNGSAAFYPTSILRQLYQPPLAEYAILHAQLLSGNDYFANLVQWLSLISCGTAVSLIVAEFGKNLKTQFFGGVLTATLPGAIVQGSSTQNDLVASLFIVSFFYFWLRAVKLNSWKPFIWTGIALGLAILTKATSYLFCFPIGLFFTIVHFLTLKKSAERKRFVIQIAVVLLIAFALNFGHYARNFALFGAPITSGDDEVRNKNVNAKIVLSNLARNYAVNLGSKSDKLRTVIEDGMKRIFGDELKNPNSTWLENEFTVNFSTHEDSAGNFVHILLITIALFLISFIKNGEKKYVYGLVFTILLGFLLFSALLKWQIWTARLQLPLFMLGSVLVAFIVSKIKLKIDIPITILCSIIAFSFIFHAEPRRVLGKNNEFVLNSIDRQKKLFKNLPDAEPFYAEAVEFIKKQHSAPESIGLHIDYNDFDYPFWLMFKREFRAAPQIYHVGVPNVSNKLVSTRPLPEFVISIKTGNVIEDTEYKEVWKKDVFRVLQKNSP